MKISILPQQLAGDPETVAMLQAFYSRSMQPINDRLADLSETQSIKDALSKYYVGYGHRSIGQCGTITLFIEGVSFVAAKAVQHHQLYNGQECSTRYIDYSSVVPKTKTEKQQLKLYRRILAEFIKYAIQHFPDTKQGLNAANAWAFDRARGWLPVALETNLSWHTSFDNLADHVAQLKTSHHKEVVQLAEEIEKVVKEHYPQAFLSAPRPTNSIFAPDLSSSRDADADVGLYRVYSYLAARKRGELLRGIHALDTTLVSFRAPASGGLMSIDYGAWRELARHRNGHCYWAEPTNVLHEWYEKSLRTVCQDADDLIKEARIFIEDSPTLGCVTNFVGKYSLAEALYIIDMRTSKSVHPILREFMQNTAQDFHSKGIPTFADMEPSEFYLKRGSQTIEKVETSKNA